MTALYAARQAIAVCLLEEGHESDRQRVGIANALPPKAFAVRRSALTVNAAAEHVHLGCIFRSTRLS
jgi:hypothetical protein